MTHASCPSDVGLFGIHFFGLGYVQSVCASVAKLGNTENRALGAVYYLKGTPGFPGRAFELFYIEPRGLELLFHLSTLEQLRSRRIRHHVPLQIAASGSPPDRRTRARDRRDLLPDDDSASRAFALPRFRATPRSPAPRQGGLD